jgi:hypothetical protein
MRKLHYVGSLPPEITERGPYLAMDWAIGTARAWPPDAGVDRASHYELTGVPCDFDTRWIIDYLDELGRRPHFCAIRTGDSADYDHMPIYRIMPGIKLSEHSVRIGRVDALMGAIAAYHNLRDTVGAKSLPPLRISLPNPLDLALFTFVGKVDLLRHPIRAMRGAWLALRNLKHYLAAMATEVSEVQRYADSPAFAKVPLVWQFETPAVLYALQLVPRLLRPALARLLAKQVAYALGLIWDVETELHLCDGDLGHKNITTPASAEEMVMFLNPLVGELEHRGIDLPPAHLPFAYGAHAPSVAREFYEALTRLSERWRVYAGVVDENDPKASRIALHLVEAALGRTVDAVACACGLGRRDKDAATKAVEAMLAVAGADRADQAEEAE